MCVPTAIAAPILKTVLATVVTQQVAKRFSLPGLKPQQPAPIIPQANTPYQRPTAPGASAALDTENIRPEDEEVKLAQNKKQRKKLERTRRGVKDLAAVDAPTDTPSMGINPSGYA